MSPERSVTYVSGTDTEKNGERGRTRTCDPCLKRALLYQLSYAPNLLKLLLDHPAAGNVHCTVTAQ
jgi:hypothetical protein